MDTPHLVVTGAARGIGRAVVAEATARGYRVSACSRAPLAADAALAGVHYAAVDVGDAEAVAQWLRVASSTHGPIDALLNNAGVLGPRVPLLQTTADDVRATLETNVVGAFNVARAVLPLLRRDRTTPPRMLHVSSYLGRHALPEYGAYCLSKFGLEALARMVACEHPDVISAALDPGMVQTDMLRAARRSDDVADGTEVTVAAQRILTRFASLTLADSGTTVSL